MRFYSTNNPSVLVDLKTAVLEGLPPDNGLYMPESINPLGHSFFHNLQNMSFQEIAFEISRQFLKEDFNDYQIWSIVQSAIDFPAPLINLTPQLHVLELWHGPSLAFKDFGARFMAQLMSSLIVSEKRQLTILVATSGDTGGAVASGFTGIENTEVIILYPENKVSEIQKKQLTTLGSNIHAIEVKGSFDDCQALVKKAFLDKDIRSNYFISSANSINISRLIPQSFYYFEAYKQLSDKEKPLSFAVPSGNFGNITAGLLAKHMGLPIHKLIAATNVNRTVPDYIESGKYIPRSSISTLSNAMDVGDPSNFVRLNHLYGNSWKKFRTDFEAISITDEETQKAITRAYDTFDYILDPHGAVAFLASEIYLKKKPDEQIVFLETAHPSKFIDVMMPLLGPIAIPGALKSLLDKKSVYECLPNSFISFKNWLLFRKG